MTKELRQYFKQQQLALTMMIIITNKKMKGKSTDAHVILDLQTD